MSIHKIPEAIIIIIINKRRVHTLDLYTMHNEIVYCVSATAKESYS